MSFFSDSPVITGRKLLFSNHDLWILIWPLIIEQLLAITLGMADIVMVSSLGEAAVSGVSLVDSINVLLVQIFAALATGGAVVCAQYLGKGSADNASRTAKQLLYTMFIAAAVLMFAGLFFRKHILFFIFGNIDPDVMDASRRYFFISLFALPGLAVYNACAALFRAQGNSRVSMCIALLVNILNIGGNAILLYGFHWGVEGVAVPTFISRTVAAVVLMFLLYKGKEFNGIPAVSIKGFSHVHFDWSLIKKILSIGIPNGLENGTFQIGKILVLSLTATFGTSAIAANAAANTLTAFEVLPGSAIGLAMLTVVGQCIGAGTIDQAVYYTKKLMKITYAAMIVLNIPLLFAAGPILSCYRMSAETTRLALYMAVTHGLCAMVIWPFSFVLPNALRAAGDAAFTMLISMISMWTVRVGMSYVFSWTHIFGIASALGWSTSFESLGIWYAMILDWVFRTSFFIHRFIYGRWHRKKII
ncbi:MAG: MATE family efflux transporter [Treponema sp.]|jgi:putative MATE family efflux protein|nr:MATE family efflux transporter [Treponema sp.]